MKEVASKRKPTPAGGGQQERRRLHRDRMHHRAACTPRTMSHTPTLPVRRSIAFAAPRRQQLGRSAQVQTTTAAALPPTQLISAAVMLVGAWYLSKQDAIAEQVRHAQVSMCAFGTGMVPVPSIPHQQQQQTMCWQALGTGVLMGMPKCALLIFIFCCACRSTWKPLIVVRAQAVEALACSHASAPSGRMVMWAAPPAATRAGQNARAVVAVAWQCPLRFPSGGAC